MKYLYLTLFWCLLLTSCTDNTVYESEIETGEDWSYYEVMKHTIDVKDKEVLYSLEFDLKHSESFSYQNLYVNITTNYPNGKSVTDEVSLQLANKRGQWSGNCSGDKCSVTLVLQDGFRFDQTGSHTITIAQYSREEVLDGI